MKNLYFSSSIRGMKEKSTRKNTVLLRSIRRKTGIEIEKGGDVVCRFVGLIGANCTAG
jgi:hypothetical protein